MKRKTFALLLSLAVISACASPSAGTGKDNGSEQESSIKVEETSGKMQESDKVGENESVETQESGIVDNAELTEDISDNEVEEDIKNTEQYETGNADDARESREEESTQEMNPESSLMQESADDAADQTFVEDGQEAEESDAGPDRREYTQKEISESLDEICTMIKEENASIGIAVIDSDFDGSWGDVQDLIYETGYAERYPFMTSISMESYVNTDGQGLICIIPVDTSTTVSVDHLDDMMETDQVLYRHERALPLLIKCDTGSEIPRILVNSVSSDSQASIYIMMDRGRLVMPNGGGVCDLTVYQSEQ